MDRWSRFGPATIRRFATQDQGRAKRLFGALVGTLQRAKKESEEGAAAAIASKRDEIVKKVCLLLPAKRDPPGALCGSESPTDGNQAVAGLSLPCGTCSLLGAPRANNASLHS